MTDATDAGDRVEAIVAERLRVDRGAVDDAARFEGPALDADSLDLVEVAEAVEADLGVHVPDETLEAVETVGDLKAHVRAELDG